MEYHNFNELQSNSFIYMIPTCNGLNYGIKDSSPVSSIPMAEHKLRQVAPQGRILHSLKALQAAFSLTPIMSQQVEFVKHYERITMN